MLCTHEFCKRVQNLFFFSLYLPWKSIVELPSVALPALALAPLHEF